MDRDRGALWRVHCLIVWVALHGFNLCRVAGQTQGDVRLVNGPTTHEGRPEYFDNGVWVSLCYSYVDSSTPGVICTQLGYPRTGAKGYYSRSYGEAPGETFRYRIICSGSQTRLSDCTVYTNQDYNCDPKYTLGISCTATDPPSKRIRLINGSTPYEGRVQIFTDGVWGTVCRRRSASYIYHLINSHIVCRELFGSGYGGAELPTYESQSRFGLLEFGAVSIRYVVCNGNETSLLSCSSSFGGIDTYCRHELDLTVQCVPVPPGCVDYFHTETGTVTSPVYPTGHNYVNDTECVLKIRTTSSRKANLTFTDIQAHESGSQSYIQVTDGNGYTTRGTSYGNNFTTSLTSYNNVIYIRKKVVAGNKGVDFQASWNPTAINCNSTSTSSICANGGSTYYLRSIGYGTTTYPGGLDCYSRYNFRDGWNITVTFYKLHLDDAVNGECQDYLEIFNGTSDSDASLGRFCNRSSIPALTTSSNQILIHFHSDSVTNETSLGFYLRIYGNEKPAETISLSGDSGVISSPGFPVMYSQEQDYKWTITVQTYESVLLTTHEFNFTCICANRLVIRDRYSFGALLASACGNGPLTQLESNSNTMYLHMQSVPLNDVTANRFNASWISQCKKTFTSASGTLTSPLYPNTYPSDKDCVWIITRPSGYYITLTVTIFNLDPPTGGICRDYIAIRDGSSELSPSLVGEFCGDPTDPPPYVITSSQESLWILFHTDDVTASSSTGFSMTYTSDIKECESSMMTANSGSFRSPNFPFRYPQATYCVWTITVISGATVRLQFDQFAVGRKLNYDCEGAYVRIYDSDDTDASTVLETLCGTTVVPVIVSSDRSLTVVLNSFGVSPAEAIGFSASYEIVTGAEIAQYDLFPFNLTAGDDELTSSSAHVNVPAGFPLGDKVENDLYIGVNGLVSFGNSYTSPWLPDTVPVICVYCAYIDNTDSVGGVYHQLYTTDTAVLDKASSEVREFTGSAAFTATQVLVVTWDRVKQGRYRNVNFDPDQDEGDATFQLVLVTDGLKSFALMFYSLGAMSWTYRGSWSYVIIGVSDGDSDNYQRNIYTNNRRAYVIDTLPGNTGRLGTWVYKVGEVQADPLTVCTLWFVTDLSIPPRFRDGFERLPQCPCSHQDVWTKMRWLWTKTRTDHQNQVTCYRMNRANSNRHYPLGKECCYFTDSSNTEYYQKLVVTPPHAGGALAFNPAYWHLRDLYQMHDKKGHDACCHPSLGPLCYLYYILRPVGKCRADIPWRFTWLFGDPHMITLDELEYTFNGWGEYTILSASNSNHSFLLQGRTSLATADNGTPLNATVYTAFGAEENGTRVFVQLDPNTNKSLIIYADGTDYSLRFKRDGEDFSVDEDHFSLINDNGSLVVSFPSQISFAVSVGVRSLVLAISVPEEFRSHTQGLLGNFNGDSSDDFQLPNGTVLSNTSTDRQIHQFGQAWSVTVDNSVLRYGPRESTSTFSHPQFSPVMMDEASSGDMQAAIVVCGTEDAACQYDYLVSGSMTFALDTKRTRESALKDNRDVKNVLPTLTVPENVTATPGQILKFSVQATDPDVGDNVVYRLVHDGNGALKINRDSGEITTTVQLDQPIDIRVFAMDSKGGQSPVHYIPVVVCECNGHGVCDNTQVQSGFGSSSFQRAVCVCSDGWTGSDCSQNHDACLSSPCHPLQQCTDLTPDQQAAFTCGPCPQGYNSPGPANQCLDIDECADNTINNCAVNCSNNAGSYLCTCPTGFRLSSDAHSCVDINECAERLDGCQQVCNNTQGSFLCQCGEGFAASTALDGSVTCVADSSTQAVCAGSGCSQGCRSKEDAVNGGNVLECFCYAGYRLDSVDRKTCGDVDECQEGVCAQRCNNSLGSFTCSCFSGFQLNEDQRTCSPCADLTYGPECSMTCACDPRGGESCHHVTGCVCRNGWTGDQCANDVDECELDPDVCGQGRVCKNNNGSYSCGCQDGYFLNNDNVCQDTDECADDTTCGSEEQCVNVPGSFHCSCLPGFTRVNGVCTDIDECSDTSHNCHQRCKNVPGSYNCECHFGYRLAADRATCIAVSDPCAEVNLSCDHGCTLQDGTDTAVCFCRSGYTLTDQNTCTDVNECSEDSPCSYQCHNTPGGFHCSCPEGSKLDNSGLQCVDCPAGKYGVNCNMSCACGIGASHCDAVEGCQCKTGWTGDRCQDDVNECDVTSTRQACVDKGAKCVNHQGGFQCQCAQGYAMVNEGQCRDVDECATSPSPCGQKCENFAGGYRCLCDAGFTKDPSTGECKDVDECAASATHTCSQECINIPGSYRCSCDRTGHVLNNDGRTCSATSVCSRTDCAVTNGGCYVSATNQETCFCNAGFKLQADGTSCSVEVINWCSQDVCDDVCTPGTDDDTPYTCSCSGGYVLNDDGRSCRECSQGTYGQNCQYSCSCDSLHTSSCHHQNGTCLCLPGWHGVTCSDDVNECSANPCGDHGQCRNTDGSFVCTCSTGYIKNTNGICTECPENSYGDGCIHTCDCPAVNTASCDRVTGACTCKVGWEGAQCDEDKDECASASLNNCLQFANSECRNTEGGYECNCRQGFAANNNGQCVAVIRLRFRVIVSITTSAAALFVEPSKSIFEQNAKDGLLALLRQRMTDLLDLKILSTSLGSVILDVESVVANDDHQSAAASLSAGLEGVTGRNLTLNGQTGDVAVFVNGTEVTAAMTTCDVFALYVTCDECQMMEGRPQCSDEEKKKVEKSDKTLILVIALAVGIPVVVALVCLVAGLCYRRAKAKKPQYQPTTHSQPSTSKNALNPTYDTANPWPENKRRGRENLAFAH